MTGKMQDFCRFYTVAIPESKRQLRDAPFRRVRSGKVVDKKFVKDSTVRSTKVVFRDATSAEQNRYDTQYIREVQHSFKRVNRHVVAWSPDDVK